MEKFDSDDVFGDFESKVKGKREHDKKHGEDIKGHHESASEKEILKRKYQEQKEALDEQYRKEMQAAQEKEMREALKQGKFNPNLLKTQKIIYISIIIVLLVYFFLDFFIVDLSLSKEKAADEEIGEDIKVTVSSEENKTAEAEEAKQEEVKEPAKEGAKAEPEKKLSGTITLIIDRIYSEKKSNITGQITQIDFTIDNGKDKVLTPIVEVFIYDDELKESWEKRSRGTYTYPIGIKPGNIQKGSITITPKIFTNLDLKKSVRLALNDTKSGFITAANDAILIE